MDEFDIFVNSVSDGGDLLRLQSISGPSKHLVYKRLQVT